MKPYLRLLFILIGLGVLHSTAAAQPVHVAMETELGTVEVAVDTAKAPVTAANFLRYVDAGLYDGGTFFRTVTMANQPQNSIRIEVIQGGMNPEWQDEAFAAIPLERTSETGLRHVDGALSMARAGPDTATHSFFICIGDQPSLNFGGRRNPDGQGFAVFGWVVQGMDVVREIQQRPADEQRLTAPVRILRAHRIGG